MRYFPATLCVIFLLALAGCQTAQQKVDAQTKNLNAALDRLFVKIDDAGKSAEETKDKTGKVAVGANDLDQKVPATDPNKPAVTALNSDAKAADESAGRTKELLKGAAAEKPNVQKPADALAKTAADLADAEAKRRGLILLLIGYGCIFLGFVCGVGWLALKVKAPGWIGLTLLGPVKTAAWVLSVSFFGVALWLNYENWVKTGIIVAGALVGLYVVYRLLFWKASAVGIATAVKAQPLAVAQAVATAANPITPTGLGAVLGKLKLLVENAVKPKE